MRLPEQQHGDAGLDQRRHQHGDAPLRARADLAGVLHTGGQRPLGDQRGLFVVRFTRRQAGELPVEQGRRFTEHVAESGGHQRLGRLHQYAQIGEDRDRRHGRHGLFGPADDQRGAGRREAVHRGSGRHGNERNPALMGGETDDIVNRPRTDRHQRLRHARLDREQQLD
ncbi:hypothetical protein D1872_256360 [compost metagenome]